MANRFARKVDGNQENIVVALRFRGAKVAPGLSRVGGGVPDLLVGYRGQLAVFENKPGEAKDRRQRELNAAELKWHEFWAGYPVFLVLSPEAAVEVLDGFDATGRWPRVHRTFP